MNKLKFDIDNIQLIDEVNDSQFALVQMDVFASGKNLHDTTVSIDTLKRTAKTILLKPLVAVYDKLFNDIGSHDDKEVAVGVVPNDANITFRELPDGRTMMSTNALIWKQYSQGILDFFERDGNKPISVELDVISSQSLISDDEDDLLELTDYCFSCVTLLGSSITPAIPLAQAEIIRFAIDERIHNKKNSFSKYDELNLEIPEKVKQNMQDGLDLWAELDGEESAKTVSLAVARYVTKNSQFTIEKFRQLQKYVPKNFKGNDLNSLLWGGFEGQAYFKDMSEKLAEIDSRKPSYFGGIIEDDNSKNSDNNFKDKEDIQYMTDKTDEKDFAEDVVDTEMAKEGSKAEEKTESPDVEKTEDMAAPVDEKPTDTTTEDKPYMAAPTEEVDMAKPTEKDPDGDGDDDTSEDTDTDTDEDNSNKSYQYSNDAYVDVMAALGFLQSQTATNNEMADEYKNSIQMAVAEMSKEDKTCDFAKVCAGLYAYAQMCNGQMTKMSEEMMSLKEFKASKDSEDFNYQVNSTMAQVKDVLPETEYAEMIEESKKYSVENITGWKNLVGAKALPFALNSKPKTEDFPVKKYGLIFDNVTTPKKKTNFVWDN